MRVQRVLMPDSEAESWTELGDDHVPVAPIKTGKNTGKNPSVVSVCRALSESEEAAAAADDDLLTTEDIELRGPARRRP
ncbi:hypothetical protein F7Q99_30305 [Streptomyces kaniharaensis]|uniref:Uncharacterized protein n=1 Tax=Streptomyces kaniharaensis TaxID=212423 RepID=A0A6N7KXL4_9ACTN|nr:hypothetical protein [Streptomyces kaniharaensis]MQS16382.1 hypothetical protein [Streptomyces kaniharaensis]